MVMVIENDEDNFDVGSPLLVKTNPLSYRTVFLFVFTDQPIMYDITFAIVLRVENSFVR